MRATHSDTTPHELSDFERSVHKVLCSLEEGDIITYGEVATEAGYPGAARAVGGFLRNSSGYSWWRVIAATGRLVPGHEKEQARRLRSEGVAIENGKVAMR